MPTPPVKCFESSLEVIDFELHKGYVDIYDEGGRVWKYKMKTPEDCPKLLAMLRIVWVWNMYNGKRQRWIREWRLESGDLAVDESPITEFESEVEE